MSQKKILFISDNKIQGFGGGSIENKKHYNALKTYCEKTGNSLKVISTDTGLTEALPVPIEKNRKIDIKVRLQGHSSFLYHTWKTYRNVILKYKPDMVFLGRSRFGFIAKDLRKELPDCKIITNIDNVEWDYVDAYFAEKRGVKGQVMRALEKIAVHRDELSSIKYSDKLIFLTERNVRRYSEVYHYVEKTPIIVPICLEQSIDLSICSDVKNVVFIGSLDYAANVKAVKQLITEIWLPCFASRRDIRLIIAGRNPVTDVQMLVKQNPGIVLVSNFADLPSLVPRNSLIVAPIEKGAGMKVKVAETLSMGLMIAASDEALVGYDKAVECDVLGGIIRANTVEEYKAAILSYCERTSQELEAVAMQNKKIYHELFSYKVSHEAIYALCEQLLGKG